MDARSNRRPAKPRGLTSDQMLLLSVAVVLALLAFFCYLLFGNVRGSFTLEAGSALEADDFLVMDWGVSAKITSDVEEIDTSRPGDYIVKVRYHGSDFYPTLHVKDTMAPVVTAKDIVVYTEKVPAPDAFIAEVQDSTQVTVTYVREPDMSVQAEQEVQLCITDAGGNAVFATAKMICTPDSTPPQILGAKNISTYPGSTVSYRSDLIITDDCDPAPVLTIDSSSVDLSTPGTYPVFYRAVDAAGNLCSVSTTVTVNEKTSAFVEESVIYAKADEMLAKIVTDDMTARQKVEAIYEWVKANCTYGTAAESNERLQSAYCMMTTNHGDCYNYYAMCSLFFERLGLPNMEVQRSKNSVRNFSTHYWNLVSIDGGETYYHFDACPQTDFDVRICLATDAQLLACHQYKDGYYTMDEGKYPATPLE